MNEHTAEMRDHPWTECPGPECPFHKWSNDSEGREYLGCGGETGWSDD